MKNIRLALTMGALVVCTGFGQGDKDAPPKKHRINYQGELVDAQGKISRVDNISISGKLQAIKMYEKPTDASRNPAENITYFNLDQIYLIEPLVEEKSAKCMRFKNREYTEVVVTLNDVKKTTYRLLLESSQRIICDIPTGAGPLEKEIALPAIKKLTITGKTERVYTQLNPRDTQIECSELDEKE